MGFGAHAWGSSWPGGSVVLCCGGPWPWETIHLQVTMPLQRRELLTFTCGWPAPGLLLLFTPRQLVIAQHRSVAWPWPFACSSKSVRAVHACQNQSGRCIHINPNSMSRLISSKGLVPVPHFQSFPRGCIVFRHKEISWSCILHNVWLGHGAMRTSC